MRSRYYNPDIKRFINRDVVDGDITNSQSLNKYSYVQGKKRIYAEQNHQKKPFTEHLGLGL